MKPLVIITTYNRKDETRQTLHTLEKTTDFDEIQLVVVDNASTDHTEDFLYAWSARQNWGRRRVFVHLMKENIGCPAALNYAMRFYRQLGQPVVKIDNDVEVLTSGWVELFERFLEAAPQVAMVGPWYDELRDEKRLEKKKIVDGFHYYPIFPLIGHMAWHAGWFLDQVGYFDLLAEDHLYGFEDLLMCHKAAKLGYEMAVFPAVKVRMLQRKNALDVAGPESRDGHVARLRPEYERRVDMVQAGEYIFTDERGQPMLNIKKGE